MEQMDSFLYVGSTFSKDGGADEYVRSRFREASGSFIQLHLV